MPSRANSFAGHVRCDHLYDFIRHLRTVIDTRKEPAPSPKETTYIIMDRADRLRQLPAGTIPALVRLQELTERNVSVILVSNLVWEKFRGGTGCSDPLLVHFPGYKKDETLAIIARDCPADIEPQFFAQFVSLLWGVFHGPCRDLNELRHLVSLLFDT